MDYQKLNEMLADEYEDVVSYMELFRKTDNSIFHDIAKEEMVHAKHLTDILESAGELKDVGKVREQAIKALERNE